MSIRGETQKAKTAFYAFGIPTPLAHCSLLNIEGESEMRKGNYNCFSYKQRQYLLENGLEPIHEMIHSSTKRTFWIFERNDHLDKLLSNWTNKTNL